MSSYSKKTNQNFSFEIILTEKTSVISSIVINHLHTNCNKPFITKELLKKYNAVQALYNDIPVLAFPMYLGDLSFADYKSWHCIPYITYPQEPRFLTARNEKRKKEDGRPAKNEKNIGLLGIDALDIKTEKIFLTEGIWDMLCLNYFGFSSIGIPGVSNLDEAWTSLFKNKIVYIIFDNDKAGEEYSIKHAKKIYSIAKEVRIIKIPKEIDNHKIKDVCDIFITFKKKKALKILEDLIETSIIFHITKEEMISEIIQARGNKDVKVDMIINMILEDIQNDLGSILSYNNNQELLIIPDGKIILTDSEITSFLRSKYGYYDIDIWRAIRDKLLTFGIKNKNAKLYFDSVFVNNKIYIGSKEAGISIIGKDNIEIKLQGEEDDIYIKTNNKIILGERENKENFSLEKILENFKYIKNANLNQLLIKAWFYNTFFDPQIKPLFILTGIAGSGKTLLMKIMKGILFGFDDYLPNIIPEEDYTFDMMIKNKKYLFLDEVKNFGFKNSAIMNKFRTLVTGGEIILRPKYSRDNIVIKPNIHLIMATDNPRMLQDHDLAQRACIVELDKIDVIKENEEEILKRINSKTKIIWHSIKDTLQDILKNLEKNKNNNIPLKNYCRQYGLANFAWRAFPDQKKDCIELFETMMIEQEKFSAEQDPLIDLIEDALIGMNVNSNNGNGIDIYAKQLYNLVYPLAKEKGIKLPQSINGFSKKMLHRESILKERFRMEKNKMKDNIIKYTFYIN